MTDSLSFSVGLLRFFFCRSELSDKLELLLLLSLLLQRRVGGRECN